MIPNRKELPVNELSGMVATIENQCAALVISSVSQRLSAAEMIKTIKAKRNQIVAFFADSKQKAYAAWKAVTANESSFTDKLDTLERNLKKAIGNFDLDQEAKRIAEQARLQKIADEQAAAERAKLARKAIITRNPEKRAEIREEIKNVAAVEVVVPVAPSKAVGERTRKTWKARVINESLVPREFLIVNEAALDAFARTTKGATNVAGVEFYEESILAFS